MAKKSRKRVNEAVEEPQEAEVVETKVRRAEADSDSDSENESSLVRNGIIAVLVVLGLILLFNFITSRNNQEDGDQASGGGTAQVEESADNEEEAEGEAESEAGAPAGSQSDGTRVSETDNAYVITVGGGESYTTITRQAIASIDNSLTPAERVAAETKIVQDAGAGGINAGQELTLSKDTVRAAADWAKQLSPEQEAAWQPYADLVVWQPSAQK